MTLTSPSGRLLRRLGILSVPLLAALALAATAAATPVTVFATGLNNPAGWSSALTGSSTSPKEASAER